jgi:rubredoxin
MVDFWLEQTKLAENMAIPMIMFCPQCNARHIDEGEFSEVAHHTHACQSCGFVWRPAKVNTHGVEFLPGYKNA